MQRRVMCGECVMCQQLVTDSATQNIVTITNKPAYIHTGLYIKPSSLAYVTCQLSRSSAMQQVMVGIGWCGFKLQSKSQQEGWQETQFFTSSSHGLYKLCNAKLSTHLFVCLPSTYYQVLTANTLCAHARTCIHTRTCIQTCAHTRTLTHSSSRASSPHGLSSS